MRETKTKPDTQIHSKKIFSSLKSIWMRGVHVWNQTVILLFLYLIWWLFLTPTALLWRFFKKNTSREKEGGSLLKKSSPLLPDHFKRPF